MYAERLDPKCYAWWPLHVPDMPGVVMTGNLRVPHQKSSINMWGLSAKLRTQNAKYIEAYNSEGMFHANKVVFSK